MGPSIGWVGLGRVGSNFLATVVGWVGFNDKAGMSAVSGGR